LRGPATTCRRKVAGLLFRDPDLNPCFSHDLVFTKGLSDCALPPPPDNSRPLTHAPLRVPTQALRKLGNISLNLRTNALLRLRWEKEDSHGLLSILTKVIQSGGCKGSVAPRQNRVQYAERFSVCGVCSGPQQAFFLVTWDLIAPARCIPLRIFTVESHSEVM